MDTADPCAMGTKVINTQQSIKFSFSFIALTMEYFYKKASSLLPGSLYHEAEEPAHG